MDAQRFELFFIALATAAAPLLAGLTPAWRLPVVVVELLLGILIGPHLLNLATPDGWVGMLGELGLTFLLFMVGMEIDPGLLNHRMLEKAVGGWLLSLGVAILSMFILHGIGLIDTPLLLAAVAVSTTALGVLGPILRDEGLLDTDFGRTTLSAAAMGELGPLLVISLLLLPTHSTLVHLLLVILFIGTALFAAFLAKRLQDYPLLTALANTMQGSGQLPVRICIVIQALFVALAAKFGLNVVMGAFASGMVVGLVTRGEGGTVLRQKLDAIGYGFLIPIFFIVAGMQFDVSALGAGPLVPLQIIAMLALFIVVRGAPIWFYRDILPSQDRLPFALYSATGLPLIVIITQIGVSSGAMTPEWASVLVSAGMISVFLFPLLAGRLRQQTAA